jgi:2-oxoisovalerate dehydrogenase E1 component beta subunit
MFEDVYKDMPEHLRGSAELGPEHERSQQQHRIGNRHDHHPMTMIQALRSAMDVMLERDDNVVVFGQDVGYFGGVFRCTEGLQAKYGKSRVFDAPISEGGIVGVAVGMGAYGLRPVVGDPVRRLRLPGQSTRSSPRRRACATARRATSPRRITIRMPCGGGIYGGQTHSQSPEAVFTQVCGLRTVMPSNPYDAKGLLIASIENDDPVIFLEPKRLYNGPFDGHHDRPVVPWSQHPLGEVPEGYYTVPLDVGRGVSPGGRHRADLRHHGVRGRGAARETGIDAEIIDLRSLWPLDLDTIVASVKKTGRCVVVHEATRTCGFGAELVALVQEHCFYHLEAPIERVTGWDTPYPHAQEWAYFPGPSRVGAAFLRAWRLNGHVRHQDAGHWRRHCRS